MRISTLAVSLALAALAGWRRTRRPRRGPLPAQEVIRQRTGQEVSQEEILRRLQSSGLTRSQVRNRLLGMGLDPSLADPYFDRSRAGERASYPLPRRLHTALTRMGLLEVASPTRWPRPPPPRRSGPRSDPARTASPPARASCVRQGDLRAPDQPLPATPHGTGAPDYTLGPGDEISLVLTGDVELGYSLPVSREGSIIIPDVGQVFVNGLTLGGLEDRLYDRLGRVYSGVRRERTPPRASRCRWAVCA